MAMVKTLGRHTVTEIRTREKAIIIHSSESRSHLSLFAVHIEHERPILLQVQQLVQALHALRQPVVLPLRQRRGEHLAAIGVHGERRARVAIQHPVEHLEPLRVLLGVGELATQIVPVGTEGLGGDQAGRGRERMRTNETGVVFA